MRRPRPELATEKAELAGRADGHSRKRPATAGNPSRRPNSDAPRKPASSEDVRREMEQVSISALLLLEIMAACQQLRITTLACKSGLVQTALVLSQRLSWRPLLSCAVKTSDKQQEIFCIAVTLTLLLLKYK